MSDPIFNSLKVQQNTASSVVDLLTLDAVDASAGTGAALSFLNNSALDPLHFTLGRISARRVDATSVQLDLAVATDPTASSSDDTTPILSLLRGAGGVQVITPAGTALSLGGALSVGGGLSVNGTLKAVGAATFSRVTVTGRSTLGTLSVSGSAAFGGNATISGNATIAGKVGIGTPAPINRLHVFNSGPGLTIDGDQYPGFRIAVNGSTVAMAQIRTDAGDNLDFGMYGPSALFFLTNNTRRMVIDANGNVGIGTSEPRSPLHVEGRLWLNPSITDQAQNGLVFASNFGDQELFLNRYDTGYWYQDLAIGHNLFPRTVLGTTNEHFFIGTRTEHQLVLSTKDTPRLVVDSKGSVGIGTTSPIKKLHVDDTSTDQTALFSRSTLSGDAQNLILVGKSHYADESAIVGFRWNADPASRVAFFGTCGHESLFARNNGCIGIGTAAPSAPLHVSGKTILSGPIAGLETNTRNPIAPTLLVEGSVDQSAGVLAVFHAPWEAYFTDRTFVSFTDRFNAERSRIRGDGAYLSSSSRQLKERIIPIDHALAKIEQLEGVYFTWKSGGQGREIGFIAEDVGAVVPELVDRRQPGFLSYDRVSALVVQALKELHQSVSELSRRMRDLENNEIQEP
jgi:hypothetical protein